jgi:hypothetical protein
MLTRDLSIFTPAFAGWIVVGGMAAPRVAHSTKNRHPGPQGLLPMTD